MKEVFFSDYLRKKAKKSLVACVAGAVVALILLLAGIVTGVGFILVSGVVAIVIALFVAATHGPSYATHRCGIRSEQVLRAHLLSKGLRDDYTAYYNLPLKTGGAATSTASSLVPPGSSSLRQSTITASFCTGTEFGRGSR